MLRILMVASEMAPFAKVGGLADVTGSLSAALARAGLEVAVVLPRYRCVSLGAARRVYEGLELWLGWNRYRVDLYVVSQNSVPVFLVDYPPLFDREGIYHPPGATGYADNHIRFAILSRAALEVARYLFRPQIFHCHDWQAAPAILYARSTFQNDPTFLASRFLLTLHNLGYQGIFPYTATQEMGLDPGLWAGGILEFHGQVNLLKGGILLADYLNTVSPTYAREIQTPEFGEGLDEVIRRRADRLVGILNGVDYSQWDPERDPYLVAHYSADDLAGKRACKQDLLREAGLPGDLETPLVGIVSRLVRQKGWDLLQACVDALLERPLRFVVLGNGETEIEEFFRTLAANYPDRFAVRIGFDEALAHRIEAGADMFLMPSRYEPCGLNQMYSLRYGTLPIVRAVGGLADSVDEETGFRFYDYTPEALLEAIDRALEAYRDRAGWESRMRRAMRKDFSWDNSARHYQRLYEAILAEPVI